MSPQAATASHPLSQPEATADQEVVTAESLIEEVSIDGMCGVY